MNADGGYLFDAEGRIVGIDKNYVVPKPAAWRASTLRLIADHFVPETPEKKVIISPSHKMREEWAEFLREEACRIEEAE